LIFSAGLLIFSAGLLIFSAGLLIFSAPDLHPVALPRSCGKVDAC
jgi:hypothetical protein